MNFLKVNIHYPDGKEEIRDWTHIPNIGCPFWTGNYHSNNSIFSYARFIVVEFSADKTEVWLEYA